MGKGLWVRVGAGILMMVSGLGWIGAVGITALDPIGNATSHSDDLTTTGSEHTGGNAGAVAAATNDGKRDIAGNVVHSLRQLAKMEVQRAGNMTLIPFVV